MKFEIYKKSQGKYTRLCTAFALALIVVLGCYRLYNILDAVQWGLSQRTSMWVATMVPTALMVLLCLFIFWLVNKPKVADFMISAEGEMKKVSWSSRQEIIVSTIIVIIVVILMAVLLGLTDLIFQILFSWLLK